MVGIKRRKVLKISENERAVGIKTITFEGATMDEAVRKKNKWFSKRKHLTPLKEKRTTRRGKGKVVGSWVNHKVQIAFIPKENLYLLKNVQ
ncbi:hypothetical protein ACT9SR_07450 [Enterococcus faecalis]|uniref:hypothetical protein n=1 Tax=Enterococcus faecalis TaxID=1351 RepID=UPI004039F44A